MSDDLHENCEHIAVLERCPPQFVETVDALILVGFVEGLQSEELGLLFFFTRTSQLDSLLFLLCTRFQE